MPQAANKYHGVLLVDKPGGLTSHDVVARIREAVGQRAVGHAGTLDPAAEGLLVVCLGRATKIARFLSGHDKTYEATIRLGRESATYDAEGLDPKVAPAPVPELDEKDLRQLLGEFTGRIKQKVPAFSAVHVDGHRLHELARRGEEVELPEREVEIHHLDLLGFDGNSLEVRIVCSAGTYVRSLAHDIGRRLGCGAYLARLRRIACGHLNVDQAVDLDGLSDAHQSEKLSDRLISIDHVLGFSCVKLNERFSGLVRHGRVPGYADVLALEGSFDIGDSILVKDFAGIVIAIGHATVASAALGAGADQRILEYDRVLM